MTDLWWCPRCGQRCLQDPAWNVVPDLFLGRHLTTVHHHRYRDPVAMRLTAAAFGKGHVAGVFGAAWVGQATLLIAHPTEYLQAPD